MDKKMEGEYSHTRWGEIKKGKSSYWCPKGKSNKQKVEGRHWKVEKNVRGGRPYNGKQGKSQFASSGKRRGTPYWCPKEGKTPFERGSGEEKKRPTKDEQRE